MRKNIAAFVSGVVFAIGLALAGMTKPSKVIGFLDLRGAWDPSLAFVMCGAIAVHFIALRVIWKRTAPLFDSTFHLPTRKDIDARLILGAALFGVGWGLGGFCPGPALVSVGGGVTGALVFAGGMTVGVIIERASLRKTKAT